MTKYKVAGMTCGGCARSVTNALKQALPDADVAADWETGDVSVDGPHEAERVRSAVEDAGFDFEGAAGPA